MRWGRMQKFVQRRMRKCEAAWTHVFKSLIDENFTRLSMKLTFVCRAFPCSSGVPCDSLSFRISFQAVVSSAMLSYPSVLTLLHH